MSSLVATESAVIDAPAAAAWAKVRPLTFEWRSVVESVAADASAAVGQVRRVTYAQGRPSESLKVLEISDHKYRIVYEITHADEGGICQRETILLRRITEVDSTFMEWTTEFYSGVGGSIPDGKLTSSKEEKFQAKSVKKLCSGFSQAFSLVENANSSGIPKEHEEDAAEDYGDAANAARGRSV